MKTLEEINKLVNNIPNDLELGYKIRSYMDKVNNDSNQFTKCLGCGRYQPAVSHICKYCKGELI